MPSPQTNASTLLSVSAHISGRRLYERRAGMQFAFAFRLLNHRQADAVFDRTPRIEHLDFAEDNRRTVTGDACQSHERCAADHLKESVIHGHEDLSQRRTI